MPTPILILVAALALFCVNAQADSILPQAVDENTFGALKKHSPFVRQVGGTHTLILTGVAIIDDATVATVFDLETRKTHVITAGVANLQGWQLVSLKGDKTDPESLMAKVQSPGGDVISVRYQKAPSRTPASQPTKTKLSDSQLQEIKAASSDPRKGFRGDGYRDVPPEILQKLSRLTPEQRLNINRKVVDLRNQGVGSDERRKLYNEAIDKALKR